MTIIGADVAGKGPGILNRRLQPSSDSDDREPEGDPRASRRVDPTKPVTALEKAWDTVRKAAGVERRLHDLRHSFCTKLAEAGVPESTMLDMMGHVSTSMLRRYSHIRARARREAIDTLEARQRLGSPQSPHSRG